MNQLKVGTKVSGKKFYKFYNPIILFRPMKIVKEETYIIYLASNLLINFAS